MLGAWVGVPMEISLAEARDVVSEFARENRGNLAGALARQLGMDLTATLCPQCGGTGESDTQQQIDSEGLDRETSPC